jgi:hypothetical protein
MKQVYKLINLNVRRNAADAVLKAPDDFMVAISEPNRTLEQNAAQWPILEAFSTQLTWPVNGEMVRMSDEEWKDVLTAAFKQETARLAKGLNGGVVMLGARTSKFGKRKFSEWIEFLHATAAHYGVVVYPDQVQA